MSQDTYSKVLINYLIVDTSVLMNSGSLIQSILNSAWTKNLNFTIVLLTFVRNELERHVVCVSVMPLQTVF